MQHNKNQHSLKFRAHNCSCSKHSKTPVTGISRRSFLSGLSGMAALGGLTLVTTSLNCVVSTKPVSSGKVLPHGAALRIKPVLTYQIEKRQDKTSWRSYGALQTLETVKEEPTELMNAIFELREKNLLIPSDVF